MLSIKKLNQAYGASHILRDIDLDIEPGTCTCVLGRNGVGKTTLMQCIMGLLPIQSGQIFYHDTDIGRMPAEARAPSGIAYVPQGRQIFPLLTVEENIRTGLFATRASEQIIPDSIYTLFPILKEMRGRRGGDLSGGQQQQLAIARALTLEPELLILDEPAEGIQPTIVTQIAEVIRDLNQKLGITVLLVEQKLPFARKLGTHFLVLQRGQVVSRGRMSELNEQVVDEFLTV